MKAPADQICKDKVFHQKPGYEIQCHHHYLRGFRSVIPTSGSDEKYFALNQRKFSRLLPRSDSDTASSAGMACAAEYFA